MSVEAPTSTNPAAATKTAVSLLASWPASGAVALDVMRMSPQQVLTSLGLELKSEVASLASLTLAHCTVPVSTLDMSTGFQATFDCQAVTPDVGTALPTAHLAAACKTNLIVNPGAENGPGTRSGDVVAVPGWKPTGGFSAAQYAWTDGDLSTTTPGPADRGSNYFYGGPASGTSTGTQAVVLPSSSSTGKATYVLAGWLGGFSNQGDDATLFLTWENAQGQPLAATTRNVGGFRGGLPVSVQLGPVTEAQRGGTSELSYRHVAGPVPTGTTQAKVVLVMQRTDGSDNDGMADNLSLVLFCA